MDKIQNLKLKKILSEYNFLLNDSEYKSELIDSNRPEFLKTVSKVVEKSGLKSKNENTDTQKKSLDKKIDDSDLSKSSNTSLKKMFRNIVKVTHPDKTGNDDLLDIYTMAKEAYELNDFLLICLISNNLNLEVIIEDQDLGLMLKLMSDKKKEIENLEKSWMWVWLNASSDEEKNTIVNSYCSLNFLDNKNSNNNMENLEEKLNEIYKLAPYLEYRNKTEFKEEYTDIYGEITKNGTNGIVKHFKEHFNKDTVFYDLGCGLGKMVIHIGLQYNPKKSCGIELSKERIKGANDLKEKYCKDNNIISFIKGDFFSNDFSDATVVYIDNTAMSHDITKKLIDSLPKGCLFICRKKPNFTDTETLIGEQFLSTYNTKKIHFLIKE